MENGLLHPFHLRSINLSPQNKKSYNSLAFSKKKGAILQVITFSTAPFVTHFHTLKSDSYANGKWNVNVVPCC